MDLPYSVHVALATLKLYFEGSNIKNAFMDKIQQYEVQNTNPSCSICTKPIDLILEIPFVPFHQCKYFSHQKCIIPYINGVTCFFCNKGKKKMIASPSPRLRRTRSPSPKLEQIILAIDAVKLSPVKGPSYSGTDQDPDMTTLWMEVRNAESTCILAWWRFGKQLRKEEEKGLTVQKIANNFQEATNNDYSADRRAEMFRYGRKVYSTFETLTEPEVNNIQAQAQFTAWEIHRLTKEEIDFICQNIGQNTYVYNLIQYLCFDFTFDFKLFPL